MRSLSDELAIDVDQGIKGEQVVAAVTRIASVRGAPKTIRVDNGPEFISKALDRWAYENGVTLDFSRPGKPTDNAFVKSFNGRLREGDTNGNGPGNGTRCQPKAGRQRGPCLKGHEHVGIADREVDRLGLILRCRVPEDIEKTDLERCFGKRASGVDPAIGVRGRERQPRHGGRA